MLSSLEVALVLLAASVFAVIALRALSLPPLVAYLAVGVLLGPHATGMSGDPEAVRHAGELGVVFLMFSIGLEFNLAKLTAMRRLVFGLGGAQVALTVLVVTLAAVALPVTMLPDIFSPPLDWRFGILVGGAVAMSSTAMVTKLLSEKRELDSDHGKRVFSVLLFQDLAVIPLLILIPALASGGDAWMGATAFAVLKAVALLALLLRFGQPLMRRWFGAVARTRSHELFTLNVLLATLAFGWVTEKAGLSMALGAFVAGMLISETDYRFQVEEDIKPFRDVLLGLFFVSIGALLNLRVLIEAWPLVIALSTVPVLAKFVLVSLLARAFGATSGTAVKTGVWLAQAGEFGFVVLALGVERGLMAEVALQPVLAAMLLSMMVSPLLIAQANRLALRLSGQEWLQRSLQLQRIATRSLARERHVIVCGYGRCGQALAHVLEAEQVPFLALDLDPDRVREASSIGESVVYGDAGRRETLLAAGLHRASALAVTFDDTSSTLKLLHTVRQLAPQLPILVRTAHEADSERLRAAGATEVVPEIVEGSLMLASHALALAGVPMTRVQRRVRQVRAGRYALLQGFFRGADDTEDAIEDAQLHLRAVGIPSDSQAVGMSLGELALGDARVTTVVRQGQRHVDPAQDLRVEAGDTLVLSGTFDQIGLAEGLLIGGRAAAA